MRIIERISYFIATTIKGIKTNLYLNVITVITIAIAFLILNIFFVISKNINSAVGEWEGKIKIIAYLKDGLNNRQINIVKSRIKSKKGVSGIKYYSKGAALREFRKELKGQASILNDVSQNVLPAYFIISVKDNIITNKAVGGIAASIKGISGIADVQYGEGVAEKLSEILIIVKMLGIGISGFMLFAIIIIVSNTIRISIFSRKDEIEIMKLVGGTNMFIEIPFIFEGVIQVFTGTVLSMLLLYFVYRLFLYELRKTFGSLFTSMNISFLSGETIIIILLGSVVLGVAGSVVSAGKFIKRSG